MGKHRHSKDKLYVTATEHKQDWGGKKDPSLRPMPKIPFNYCPLNFQLCQNPVATPEGTVFDLLNIIPFIKKYQKCPVTGSPLKVSDLIKLKIHRNKEGQMHCPMSYKVFNDNMKIVVIAPTGNVYSGKIVDELNKNQKYWFDLLTDTPFKPEEIVILQDPLNIKNKIIDNFYYKKTNIDFNLREEQEDTLKDKFIEQSKLGKRVIAEAVKKQKLKDAEDLVKKKLKQSKKRKIIDPDELLTIEEFLEEREDLGDWFHSQLTSGRVSSSVTSTAMQVQTEDDKRRLSKTEMMLEIWKEVKTNHLKSYLQMKTNLGTINIVLHSDFVVKACYYLLRAVKQEKLVDLRFCKMVEGTIIQVENPRVEKEFLDGIDQSQKFKHDRGGLLTINLEGELKSLGFTLSEAKQLDHQFSVLGEIAGGFQIIKNVAEMGSKDGDLKAFFRIEKVTVVSDGYREACKKIRRRLLGIDKIKEEQIQKEEEKQKKKAFLSRVLG